MNFTLKQLKYVEAAGRLGSIAKAGNEMAISQSSITAAIDALEQSLEYDLFVRTPAKGIQPTPAGRDALQLIRNFIHQSRHFEAELQSNGSDAAGLVRIACYATAAPAFLPPILKSISKNFPGISVKVMEGNMAAIMEYLSDGLVDLVFTYSSNLAPGQPFQPLFDAPPYALLPLDDPLCNKPCVTFAELAERPMVMLDLPYTREYFMGMFQSRWLLPNVAHTARSSEIARALVAGGFGYTILNIMPSDYGGENAKYKAVPIIDETDFPTFGIATPRDTRQPKTVESFIGSCMSLSKAGAFDPLIVRP